MATADLLPPPVPSEFDVDERYEFVGDERREKPPMSAFASTLANRLSLHLSIAGKQRESGLAFTEVLFVLQNEPRLHRRPDVAFVSYERWRSGPPVEENAWGTVPELTVEIVSPTNEAEELEHRIVEYFACGVQQVWILHPSTRRMYVHESLTQVRVVTETDPITWDAMLPGWSLPLAQLFAELEPPKRG